MNTKLVESLVQIIRSLTPEERTVLDSRLQNEATTQNSTELSGCGQLNAERGFPIPSGEPILRGSKASDLLKFADTWQGDDLEECLQLVYVTRSKAEF